MPWALGFAGAIYGVIAAICSAAFLLLAFELNRSVEIDRRAAHRLFAFSISYLFLLFAVLLVDHSGGSITAKRWSHVDRASVAPSVARQPNAARSFKVREV